MLSLSFWLGRLRNRDKGSLPHLGLTRWAGWLSDQLLDWNFGSIGLSRFSRWFPGMRTHRWYKQRDLTVDTGSNRTAWKRQRGSLELFWKLDQKRGVQWRGKRKEMWGFRKGRRDTLLKEWWRNKGTNQAKVDDLSWWDAITFYCFSMEENENLMFLSTDPGCRKSVSVLQRPLLGCIGCLSGCRTKMTKFPGLLELSCTWILTGNSGQRVSTVPFQCVKCCITPIIHLNIKDRYIFTEESAECSFNGLKSHWKFNLIY